MRQNLLTMKNILFALFTVLILAQCSEEDVVPQQQPVQAASEELPLTAEPTGSMTISGVFTTYGDVENCKTCTYVVPENLQVVDGKELNLKAGSVICLDKAKRYGDIDFVNLEGTEESPILIGSTIFK